MSALRSAKTVAHDHFDPLWHFLPYSESQKQQLRSWLYQLWGAVLANELKDLSGVRDPFQGNQHISALPSTYYPKLAYFKKALIQKCNGNISQMANMIMRWNTELTKKNYLERTTDKDIYAFLDKDPLILELREKIGITKASSTGETEIKPEEKPEKKIELKSSGATPASNFLFFSTTSKRTAEENFIEGQLAFIQGDSKTAISYYHDAADEGHGQAAYQLWRILKSDPAKQVEAFRYLDCAERLRFGLAWSEIAKLIKNSPSIYTPHGNKLRLAAEHSTASAEAIIAWGNYLKKFAQHCAAKECYLRVIPMKSNVIFLKDEATLGLCDNIAMSLPSSRNADQIATLKIISLFYKFYIAQGEMAAQLDIEPAIKNKATRLGREALARLAIVYTMLRRSDKALKYLNKIELHIDSYGYDEIAEPYLIAALKNIYIFKLHSPDEAEQKRGVDYLRTKIHDGNITAISALINYYQRKKNSEEVIHWCKFVLWSDYCMSDRERENFQSILDSQATSAKHSATSTSPREALTTEGSSSSKLRL